MPHTLQSPFDREAEPEDGQPNNGFYLYSNAPIEELFGNGKDAQEIRREDRRSRPLQPDFVPREDIDKLHALIANAPRREQFPRVPAALEKPRRHWWGLAADLCYLVIEAGAFLMVCWIIALGLPLMLLLLLSGGQLDMMFIFLGTLFGAFAEATPERQYGFASSASWCLIGLATAIAALRLPRFLDRVAAGLGTRRAFR